MSDLKLVLHVSEADRWHAALGNLVNLTALDDVPDVRVVANGSAVYVLQGEHDQLSHMAKAAAKRRRVPGLPELAEGARHP